MSDHNAYGRFMGKAEFDKAVNSLLGIIEGITIDSKINGQEVQFLQTWLGSHSIRIINGVRVFHNQWGQSL